jgi:hypothetical protein
MTVEIGLVHPAAEGDSRINGSQKQIRDQDADQR